MKAVEVHKLSNDEIKVEATRLRRRLFDLRAQTVTEKIEDTSQFKKTRKDLARVLTELTARKAKSVGASAGATAGAKAKSVATGKATGGKS